MAQISMAIKLLEKALPMLGAGSAEGKDVMRALTTLSKHLPPGSVTPGIEQTQMQNFMSQQRQAQPQQAMMQALAAKGGAPGGSPGGAPPASAAA